MHGIANISILYIPFLIALGFLTFSSYKLQFIEIQKKATRVIFEITLVNACYYAILCLSNDTIIRILYTSIFILLSLVMIEVFWYVVKLTETKNWETKVGYFISKITLIMVIAMEFPNFFKLWSFSLLRYKYDGQHFYTFGARSPHILLLIVVCVCLILTVYLCVKKIIQVSSVYRRRYIVFLVAYLIVMLAELYFDNFVRFKSLNLTYAFYAIIALEIYWDCYRSAHQYRSFIDHFLVDKLEVGLVMFNYADTLESYNKRSSGWFGLEEQMHGKLTRQIFIEENQIPVTDELVNQEFQFKIKDDYIDGRMEVLNEGEKTTGVFFVFYDNTKEEEARISLEKYSQNRNDFVQNMTHELRTPLNAVIGFSEQLLEKMPNGEYKEQVGFIDKSGRLILRYIDEMTDMMSLSDGIYTINKSEFKVFEEINRVLSRSAYVEHNDKIAFETNVDPMTPSVMYGDANSINIVLDNIIDNAFKYTERGRVSVETKWYQDSVRSGEFEVVVNDTGCGMSEEVLENIYLAFSVGKDIQHKHENGIGIGLYITKKILDLLGGTILVESHLNIGTKVTVRIPMEVIDPTPISTSERKDNLKNISLSLNEVRALVVEDDLINARSIKRQLEHFGAEVKVCNSGEESLKTLATDSRFDMIFMDYIMPGLDGIETTKRIRSSGVSVRKIPIIAVTADVSQKRKEEFHRAKMNDVLFKPFELVELMDILARWLPPKKVILSKREED